VIELQIPASEVSLGTYPPRETVLFGGLVDDAAGRQMRYRVWVTVGPAELPFSAAITLQKVLNRQRPELSAIGCGSAPAGQVYSVSCDAGSPGEARRLVNGAFRDAISNAGLKGAVRVAQIQLERLW
jgi:hypothetical protein